MLRKFTFPALLIICSFVVGKYSLATTYVNNGTNTNYTLNAGDSLYIASGTYTGTISGLNSATAKITVSDMAIFQPAGFPNNAVCTMNVYGTAIFNYSIKTNTNFILNNYGVFSVNGITTMNGSNQEWTNYNGALISFVGNVVMNGDLGDNNVLTNYGTINASANFQMNSGSKLNNYKNFSISGNALINGGDLNNIGKFETTGSITLNSGASAINNYCRMISSGGIFISNGNMNNYSYLWARNNLGLGTITVSSGGNLVNVTTLASAGGGYIAIIHGRSLIHTGGTVTGSGYLYFYGTTSQTGGTTGATGVTTDTLKMNDITRVNTTIFYDAQAPTVYPNAIYNAWGVPDSVRGYVTGCSPEIVLAEVPLAINWNSFEVNLINNIPLLNWSAEFVQGTVFEIQRSYDGRNFSTIHELPYEVSQSAYEYKDRMVNTQAPIVYYRIRSVEISGVEKYTQTRIVKFNNKPGSIYTAPNPFTNNFIINYTSAERETITIRMFNMSGQQMLTKNVVANDGNNNITITEAAQLAKGIYVVQVTKGYNVISSSKIIKQ